MSFIFGIVHNNEKERVENLTIFLENIRNQLRKNSIESKIIHSSHQNNKCKISKIQIIKRQLYDSYHIYRFNKYRNQKNPNFLILTHNILNSFINPSPKTFRHIESCVCKKHFFLIQSLIENNGSYLVIFESDTVIYENSSKDFLSFLDWLRNTNYNQNIFVDLAGGYDINDIRGSLNFKNIDNLMKFEKPITNTGCVYAVDSKLATKALTLGEERPFLKSVGFDFFLNELFMKHLSINCFHGNGKIFGHGSFMGVHTSWSKNF
jgi:hypothetical protein